MIALMYHDIVPAGAEDSSGFPGRDAALYKVTPETFEAHLAAIDHAGRTHRSAPANLARADLRAGPESDAGRTRRSAPANVAEADPRVGPELRVDPIITFDDGGVSALYAADELERRGRRGYFFVTANYIGASGFLDADDLRDLHRRGHVIGSHSSSHPLRMARCSDAQLRTEWTTSCARLADILGGAVQVASVPGGDYAPRVAEAAAAAGIRLLFTSEPSATRQCLGTITVNGRFTVQKWTTARTVAGLAAGAWFPCARQNAVWTMKKLGKRTAGDLYLAVRKLVLRHGDEVSWGDEKIEVRR